MQQKTGYFILGLIAIGSATYLIDKWLNKKSGSISFEYDSNGKIAMRADFDSEQPSGWNELSEEEKEEALKTIADSSDREELEQKARSG